MKRIKVAVLILGVFAINILLINGCAALPVGPAGIYWAEVDSIAIANSNLKNKTYVLTSAIKDVSDDDIQFKEFAKYIENALSKTGYKRVASEKADLIIRFAYGIGAPKTETYTKTYTTSTGYSYPVGWIWINVPPQTETVSEKSTTYEKFLMLEAYDSKDRRSQLWRTTMKSEGWSSDLRVALPHMIAAAIYKFGTNTSGKLKVAMYKNAPVVLDIMRSSDTKKEAPFTGKERLGVRLELLTLENQLAYNGQKAGVLVIEVAENSVAQKMGLQKYDIILAVNNKIIDKPAMLLEEVRNTKPDGEIRLTFFSWNKLQDVSETGSLK
jgi:hypothetical protein